MKNQTNAALSTFSGFSQKKSTVFGLLLKYLLQHCVVLRRQSKHNTMQVLNSIKKSIKEGGETKKNENIREKNAYLLAFVR